MNRDPRIHPRPGDVLWLGSTTKQLCTVVQHYEWTPNDCVSYQIDNFVVQHITLVCWRKLAAEAEILKAEGEWPEQPNKVMNRDPRIDPKPGDLIYFGNFFDARYCRVLPRLPGMTATDISCFHHGDFRGMSLSQWREFAKEATVIKVEDEWYKPEDPALSAIQLYRNSPEIHAAVQNLMDIAAIYASTKDMGRLKNNLVAFFGTYDRARTDQIESLKTRVLYLLQIAVEPTKFTHD